MSVIFVCGGVFHSLRWKTTLIINCIVIMDLQQFHWFMRLEWRHEVDESTSPIEKQCKSVCTILGDPTLMLRAVLLNNYR